MYKKIEPTNEVCVKFSDDEIAQLGLELGGKYSVHVSDEGNIELKKFQSIEIDLEDVHRSVLEFLLKESCDRDVSVNQVISDVLDKALKTLPELIEANSQTSNHKAND
jgi:hypothetical protein